MKKIFSLALVAVAALTFVSCDKKGGEGSEYTKIELKQTEIALAVGESQKLNVVYEPTTLDAPVCEWSTSNAEVATVENGTVTAVALGEANITAKHGEFTAVCKVTVADARDLYAWGGVTRFSEQEPFEKGGELPIYDVELSDGVYKCYYGMADYYFWDDGVYISGNSLAGEGYLFAIQVPCYVIAEGDYAGYGVGSPIYFVDDKDYNAADTAFAYCVPAGSLDNIEDWYDFITNEESTVNPSDCWKGPECLIFSDQDGEGGFYYAYWPGIITKGYIYGDYQAMRFYDFSIDWADGYYGLAIDETGEALKDPLEWATHTSNYVLQRAASAPKRVAVNETKKLNTQGLKKVAKSNKVFMTSDKQLLKK